MVSNWPPPRVCLSLPASKQFFLKSSSGGGGRVIKLQIEFALDILPKRVLIISRSSRVFTASYMAKHRFLHVLGAQIIIYNHT